MNRVDALQHFRDVTGYPERGTTGTDRLNRAVNRALRAIWPRLPRSLKREDHHFELELPYSTGTLSAHSADTKVLVLADQPAGTLPSTGVLCARWLEVVRAGVYHRRRIREVYSTNYSGTARDHIVLDEAWENTTDTGMTFRIWTEEYPIPGFVEHASDLYLTPDTGAERGPLQIARRTRETAQYLQPAGSRIGTPDEVSLGSFYQLPAPHYAPTATVTAQPLDPEKWGWDALGNERGSAYGGGQQYGPAGTFAYRVCHGWGRRVWLHPSKGSGLLMPFYLSAPSTESSTVTTTWGAGMITCTSPNIDYVYGYGNDPTKPSFNRSGLEKWFFRKRTATQDPNGAGNNSAFKLVESDDVYYLIGVVDGGETAFVDRGQYDPADRHFPLRDWHGHQHLVFNRVSTAREHVRLTVTRKTETLDFSTDAPVIPDTLRECIIAHIKWELLGNRAGSLAERDLAKAEFEGALSALHGEQVDSANIQSGFTSTLTGGSAGRTRWPIASSIREG